MTQGKANKIFETELGQQLDVIYVTPDDQTFIRHEEAVSHIKEMLNNDPEKVFKSAITEWYPEFTNIEFQKSDKIAFETAKLAKEKGYNEICDSHFEDNGAAYDSYGLPFKPNDEQAHEILFARPTQSLLKKWLREVHGIYVNSDHDLNPKGDGILYHTNWGYINAPTAGPRNTWYRTGGGYSENEEFKTYEEALEVGLREGLKLITK
jgi:hypothetical protein